ncbi:MAG: hypothetical protein JWP75_3514 [Frondihabitans sp.]|nr:hypothetical protein [Frondihabitans sp.]
MSPKASDEGSTGDARKDVERARAEFAETLDEIENRLNPRIQARRAQASIKRRFERDPRVLGAAAVGAAALAATIAGVARIASRRR